MIYVWMMMPYKMACRNSLGQPGQKLRRGNIDKGLEAVRVKNSPGH